MRVPFDSKAGDSRLLRKNIASNLLDDRLGRRVGVELIRVVFVIHVVANANEFTAIVGASQQDDSNTEYVCVGNARCFGGISLENEFVDTDGDRPNEERVQFLVILIAGSGCVRLRQREYQFDSRTA